MRKPQFTAFALFLIFPLSIGLHPAFGEPVLNPGNEHYYEAVSVNPSNPFVNFESAEIYAESRDYMGMKGPPRYYYKWCRERLALDFPWR